MDDKNLPLDNLILVISLLKLISRYSLFVNNDQHKILDLMKYNLLDFRNFHFWPYGHLAQISAISIFWHLQKLYEH